MSASPCAAHRPALTSRSFAGAMEAGFPWPPGHGMARIEVERASPSGTHTRLVLNQAAVGVRAKVGGGERALGGPLVVPSRVPGARDSDSGSRPKRGI